VRALERTPNTHQRHIPTSSTTSSNSRQHHSRHPHSKLPLHPDSSIDQHSSTTFWKISKADYPFPDRPIIAQPQASNPRARPHFPRNAEHAQTISFCVLSPHNPLVDSIHPPNMPYNTRRKSLSLSELGITVPKRSRASSQSHPSPPATVIDDEPVTKKPKRSHESLSPPPALMSPPKTKTLTIRTEPPSRLAEHTPPPSPGTQTVHTIDTEGISDDVVVATIKQLEKTANRPHLVKELAAVLCHCIGAVEK